MTNQETLSEREYFDEVEKMASRVIGLMRESDAETFEEWHKEWFNHVWTEVENCTLRYDEENYPHIVEYSTSHLSPDSFEDDSQMVREMMEEDVINRMEKLPQVGVNPPE